MTTFPSQRAGRKRSRLTLLLLFAVFAGPMIAAWIAVKHDAFRPGGSSVKGQLVNPARPVTAATLRAPDGSELPTDLVRGRWLLLYIDNTACDAVCERNLYNMRQTRLAVGEDTHRVRRLLVVTDGPPGAPLKQVLANYPGLAVATAEQPSMEAFLAQFHVTPGDDPARAQRLYILDPFGNLVLFYAPAADPKGMLEDLERLLKASQIG